MCTVCISDLVELAELIKNKKILLYQYQRGERGTKRLIREIGSDPQYNYIVQLSAERANDFFRLVSSLLPSTSAISDTRMDGYMSFNHVVHLLLPLLPLPLLQLREGTSNSLIASTC